MGLFSRRRPERGDLDPVAVVVDPVAGTARVGADAVPLYPLVMDDRTRDALLSRYAGSDRPVLDAHASGLTVAYVLERDAAWEYVTAATASRLGLTGAALAAESLAWLERVDPVVAGGDGRFLLEVPAGREDLAASLILRAAFLHDLFDEFVAGDPVVAVGQRVSMHVCGADDAESVEGLRLLARGLYDAGDATPVSTALYRLGADGSATPW
jgi:hypothetical protein